MRPHAAVTFALVIATVAGCARREYEPQHAGGAGADNIVVDAINDNYYDARIHAIYGGSQRHTLGTVPGNGGETTVSLKWQPEALTFEVTFIIDGRTYLSQSRDVIRGERFELRLPPNIDQSGFFRRVGRS